MYMAYPISMENLLCFFFMSCMHEIPQQNQSLSPNSYDYKPFNYRALSFDSILYLFPMASFLVNKGILQRTAVA
ncbi:hypothetical protein DJ90_6435 [Paenibacillus macerans]|uniref:Uncharacterized protein n=1 Tax=Paenibacillus macerans TaxID=44252 RepID=A0A090ZN53_PAEMA|nr:hypothetical protein DJ90_6435 [Paenibacillus macerans]